MACRLTSVELVLSTQRNRRPCSGASSGRIGRAVRADGRCGRSPGRRRSRRARACRRGSRRTMRLDSRRYAHACAAGTPRSIVLPLNSAGFQLRWRVGDQPVARLRIGHVERAWSRCWCRPGPSPPRCRIAGRCLCASSAMPRCRAGTSAGPDTSRRRARNQPASRWNISNPARCAFVDHAQRQRLVDRHALPQLLLTTSGYCASFHGSGRPVPRAPTVRS